MHIIAINMHGELINFKIGRNVKNGKLNLTNLSKICHIPKNNIQLHKNKKVFKIRIRYNNYHFT